MGESARVKRRRARLLAMDPFCPDCGVEMVYYHSPGSTLPDNFATIEHVNSKIRYPDGRPPHGKTILLCYLCNENRARAEQKLEPLQVRRQDRPADRPHPAALVSNENLVRRVSRKQAQLLAMMQEEPAEPAEAAVAGNVLTSLEEARKALGL